MTITFLGSFFEPSCYNGQCYKEIYVYMESAYSFFPVLEEKPHDMLISL